MQTTSAEHLRNSQDAIHRKANGIKKAFRNHVLLFMAIRGIAAVA